MFSKDVQEAYERIKADILNGVYKFGEPLPEIPLSVKYGIKRTRMRQILQELEKDAFIERIPVKGAFVKPITSKDLQEIYEIREALEGMAARLAARRRQENSLQGLIELFERHKQDSSEDDLLKKVEVGKKIHQFIFDSCDNGRILLTMAPLRMQIMRIWNTRHYIPEIINKSFDEHIEILMALKERNEKMAERKMREHICSAFKAYIKSRFLRD